MSHDVVQDLLSSYLDGDLSPQQRDEVEEHLASCAECREELEMLRLTLDALHDLPDLPAPAGFTDAVLSRIGEEAVTVDETPATEPVAETEAPGTAKVVSIERRRRFRVPVWAPVALAAAACVVVGMVWWVQSWRWGEDQSFVPSASRAEFAEDMSADALADAEMAGERGERQAQMPVRETTVADEFDGVAEAEVVAQLEQAPPASGEAAGPAGAVDTPAATRTAAADSGAYYAPWEKADGDALADAVIPAEPEPEEASRPSTTVASDTRRQLPSGSAIDVIDNTGTVAERERQRLAREEEAFRALYGGDGDAVADMGALEEDEEEDSFAVVPDAVQARSAYSYEGEAASEIVAEEQPRTDEDADYGRYRSYEDAESLDESDLLGDEDADDALVDMDDSEVAEIRESKSAARPGAARARDRADSARGHPAHKRKAESDAAPATLAGATSEAEFQQPAAPPAPAEPAVASPPTDAPPMASAEWTLQTTEPLVLYRMAELCAEGLACTWLSPNRGPVSLNAQQNYQIVTVTLPKAAYELLQSRLRAHGSLLVRTEDIALATGADPVTVKVVIEYLP